MTRIAYFFALFCLASAMASAQTRSGYLVDSKCYASLESNRSPGDTQMDVNRDRGSEVRYCRATAKTRSFTVVQVDGQSFQLDSVGNAKSAQLAAKVATKAPLFVTVTGVMSGKTVKTEAISPTK